MKDITKLFDEKYRPIKALVICQATDNRESGTYVESYDMDKNGFPINAHPLSLKECASLAQALDTTDNSKYAYLQCAGLLPKNLLHIHYSNTGGHAVWTTPAQRKYLTFTRGLGIPSGMVAVPAMVWKATRHSLQVWAVKSCANLTVETPLFKAPFFNIYTDGKVCMGTVHIDMNSGRSLPAFMEMWEQNFWNSAFSHVLGNTSPVKGNIIQLWKKRIGTETKFPLQELVKTGLTIERILK